MWAEEQLQAVGWNISFLIFRRTSQTKSHSRKTIILNSPGLVNLQDQASNFLGSCRRTFSKKVHNRFFHGEKWLDQVYLFSSEETDDHLHGRGFDRKYSCFLNHEPQQFSWTEQSLSQSILPVIFPLRNSGMKSKRSISYMVAGREESTNFWVSELLATITFTVSKALNCIVQLKVLSSSWRRISERKVSAAFTFPNSTRETHWTKLKSSNIKASLGRWRIIWRKNMSGVGELVGTTEKENLERRLSRRSSRMPISKSNGMFSFRKQASCNAWRSRVKFFFRSALCSCLMRGGRHVFFWEKEGARPKDCRVSGKYGLYKLWMFLRHLNHHCLYL